jgi:prohibitin 1
MFLAHALNSLVLGLGIRDFQQIVAQGISSQLLEWKGIEATENLAKSANAKIVVIGNSKGLPLILGQ